ncbi:hypothetical protein NL532_30000 [Mesorhizobium sp. C120A]|uniref:hypothetical protein n=1 Tax=unclassified Mesorhizobium TaxID=325217 RepID=UPI000A025745|nr:MULTISPECIES: hypothetical protein [unclassified Mesorhizobium]WJI48331.1 hypothetical protein NL532_30000 [Mesorhizobium sp. C120A]
MDKKGSHEPAMPNNLLDQLLAGGAASAAFEQGGLLDTLKKALTERAVSSFLANSFQASREASECGRA